MLQSIPYHHDSCHFDFILEDDKSSMNSTVTTVTKLQNQQSGSMTISSSGYHTLSDKAGNNTCSYVLKIFVINLFLSFFKALTETDKASMINMTADTSSVSPRQNRKTYDGMEYIMIM